jgi:hypothetical protein
MKVRKVIRKVVEGRSHGVSLAGGVDAVVSAHLNEPGRSLVRLSRRQRIVRRDGTTVMDEDVSATPGTRG